MSGPPSVKLGVASHQVGGHMKEGEARPMVDEEGRFYKPYEEGPRAGREILFYQVFNPQIDPTKKHVAYPSPDGSVPEGASPSEPPRSEDMEALKPFLPGFWGTTEHDGQKFIVMEDMCKAYKKVCIMDAKMGFTTIFPWADEKYRTKNSPKDVEFTSASCGFRISGLQVFRAAEGETFKPDRLWGRTLNKDNITSAFELFASGGLISPQQLYGAPEFGILAKLKPLEAWAKSQRSFQMYQASVLIMYEGEAKTIEEANVRIALVDYSYTFQTLGQGDENLSSSISSLMTIMGKVASA